LLKRLIVSAALAGSVLVAPLAAEAASAGVAVHTSASATACKYRRDGRVWRCITPGAYCPKAARNRYGYAKATKRKYKCSQYTRTTWRWKRV
jgi:hypothetical protein